MKTPLPLAVLFSGLLATTALVAYDAGGFAFTKRVETKLLAEPKPLADAAGTLPFGHKVKVEEVRGSWLRVSEGNVAGWVFAGNLSETKPLEGKGLDGLGLAASKTTATAAARPLSPAALEYASGNQLTSAREDLEWMIATCAEISADDVEHFLQESKKGEYQ